MTGSLPSFTVVIASYMRPAPLARCLRALAALDYPADRWEVVVVDDGSPTPLEPVVRAAALPVPVRCLRQDNGGPGAARNRGAWVARGEYLAFTDDDCEPAREWLRALADRIADYPRHLVGGRVVNALPQNPYSTASQLLAAFLNDYYARVPDDGQFFSTNNLVVPADDFRALGGFETVRLRDTAEDRELCNRWMSSGRVMAFAPDAVVGHAHELDLTSFVRQHFHYGRGTPHFLRLRVERGQRRAPARLRRFYGGLLLFPFRVSGGVEAPFRQSMLLLLSQAAYACGVAVELLAPRPPGWSTRQDSRSARRPAR